MGDAAIMKPQKNLPLFILSRTVIFPGNTLSLELTEPEQIEFFDELLQRGKKIIACGYSTIFGQDRVGGLIKPFTAATECAVANLKRTGAGYSVCFIGTKRLEFKSWDRLLPIPIANFVERETVAKRDDLALAGLIMSLADQAKKILPQLGDDKKSVLNDFENTTGASEKADLIVYHLTEFNKEDYIFAINHLWQNSLKLRVQQALNLLVQKRQRADVDKELEAAVNKEHRNSTDLYMKQRRKEAILKELAEIERQKSQNAEPSETFEDRVQKRIEEFKAAIDDGNAEPNIAEAYRTINREFKRYGQMNAATQEANTSRDYLDWLISLPWLEKSEDKENITEARDILDADHYGMKTIKKRILEFLAVRKLSPKKKAPILCFVGPPGVGKTSIGKSLARAMGRKFYRQSLGGVQDDAAIRGHRRTYVGALPGRIIQMIRHVGVSNPILMLDEIDKLTANQRGDPASALLEALDPEQNHSFSDHYVEIPFDLSKVVFICTANYKQNIPAALYDRMEVIELSGYTPEEKFQIADKFLLPKQLNEHGLGPTALQINRENIFRVIEGYTQESGVRNLERELANIIRGAVVKMAEGLPYNSALTPDDITEYLGITRYEKDVAGEEDAVGVSTGLYWSQVGGGILHIETVVMPCGTGKLLITGSLKDPPPEYAGTKLVNSMRESIVCALDYVRSRTDLRRANKPLPTDFFETHDFHINFPSMAMPKDGPSAGLAITTALTSLVTEKPVNHLVAMTGEMDIVGRALPIGGLKEKILGAHRAGIKKILIPIANKKDLTDIPDEIKNDLEIITVSNINEVLPHALVG